MNDKPAVTADQRRRGFEHLARQFDLMAKGCRSMGLHSLEDDYDGLRQDANKGEVDPEEIVRIIDYDYTTGQNGRAAAELLIGALCKDLSAHTALDRAPASSVDFHQRRGAAIDIIDEALESYRQFMLDDDFDYQRVLFSIMERMQARRVQYEAPVIAEHRDALPPIDPRQHPPETVESLQHRALAPDASHMRGEK